MNKATRRTAALMMAVMMVFLAGRFPVRAAETYTITLYGNGGYCIDDENKKQESIALDVSAGTVLTTDDNCGNVSWQSSDPNLGFAGWADADGAVYGSSDTFTVNGNAELYAIWESLVDENAFAAAASDEPESESSEAEESAAEEPSAVEETAADESEASESEPEAYAPIMLGAPSNQKTITVTIDGGDGGYYIDANGVKQTSITLQNTIDPDAETSGAWEIELTESLGYVEWLNSDQHCRLYGWNVGGSSHYIYDYSTYSVKQDETITAEWETCNLITFDSGSQTAHFDYDDDTPSTVTIKYAVDDTLGYTVGEPINTDAAKVFYSWDTDGDGVMDMSDYYGFAPSGDTTITAVWTDKFTATYDPNGGYYEYGDGTKETQPYVYEGVFENLSVPAMRHPDTSLSQIGWAFDKDGDSMIPENPTYDDLNGKTLYAAWLDTLERTDSTGEWVYAKESKTAVRIVGYVGADANLVLPEILDGLDVVALTPPVASMTPAFSVAVESLVIPDCVKRINMTCMYSESSLRSVVMGNGITFIPGRAFADCTALNEVVLPANLETIDGYAFENDTALTSIDLPEGLLQINAFAFQNSGLTSLDLPASCTYLYWRAFGDCSNLEEVTIRGNLQEFGNEVFAGTAIKTIYFKGDLPVDADPDPAYQTAFTGLTATAYYPITWTSVPSSTYQGATNITWIREATAKVMQIDHQTAVPDQVLVNGTALTASQYVATVTQDADGKDIVIIELTEDFKSTLTDDAKIEAVYASETFDGTVYPENISYATLDIENGSQTIEGEAAADSLKPVVITVSGKADDVESVSVDGSVLDPGNYTVTAGSAIITLLEEYLATLPAGEDEHEVTVTFKDGGIATASFSVVTTVPEEQPEPAADESSAEESTVEESSAEESNTEESSTEESSTEESAAEESGTGDSKPEDSKTEESKAEESKPEESKPAESSADEPSPVVPSGSPKTGDPGYLIWVIAIAASGVVLALLLVFLLKKRRK